MALQVAKFIHLNFREDIVKRSEAEELYDMNEKTPIPSIVLVKCILHWTQVHIC